ASLWTGPSATRREEFLAGPQNRPQTLRSGLNDPLTVRGKPSGFGESEEYRLRQLVAMQIAPLFGFLKPVDQRLRSDDPADAQPRKGNLREASEQDDLSRLVQLLERRKRIAFIPQSPVDVVLDDYGPRVAGEAQEIFARRQG